MSSIAIRVAIKLWCASRRITSVISMIRLNFFPCLPSLTEWSFTHLNLALPSVLSCHGFPPQFEPKLAVCLDKSFGLIFDDCQDKNLMVFTSVTERIDFS
jgi:hypothetical protein